MLVENVWFVNLRASKMLDRNLAVSRASLTRKHKSREKLSHTLRELGLRLRHPYNVRHSCASRWLKAGIKPAFAAQQLGHSVEMFFRIYAKWIDVDETKKQEKMMDAI